MSNPAFDQLDRSEALAMLRWLISMGADEAIGPTGLDRFAEAERVAAAAAPPPRPAPPPVPRPERTVAATPALPLPLRQPTALGGSAGDAMALAASCNSFAEIAAVLATFDACPLKRTATSLVYLDGHPEARLLFIGEAPGREEDLAGQAVRRPLRPASRQDARSDRPVAQRSRAGAGVLITNLIFWRPPGNRKPTEAETLMCLPFVQRTIALARPESIVCLGATPAQRLSEPPRAYLELRGTWRRFPRTVHHPLLPTLHPAYLCASRPRNASPGAISSSSPQAERLERR